MVVMRGLTKFYGQMCAVNQINLDIPRGSMYGFVGPNGAGKTTTLSMVTGLLKPDGGQVWVSGIDVWQQTQHVKAKIGTLPDRLRLFDRLSGQELLTYTGLLRGIDKAIVAERSADLLEVLGLADDARKAVADYSAGMAKKIGLALATGVLATVVLATKVSAAGVGLSPMSERFDLYAGRNQTGKFTVFNVTDYELTYRISTTPFSVVGSDEDHDYTSETAQTEMTRWVSLDQNEVTIPAQGNAEITYTISVPIDAPGGSQHASFLVAPILSASQAENIGIQNINGIRFLVFGSIRDGNSRETGELLKQKFPWWLSSGALTARAQVKNTGNLDFPVTQQLAVKNLMGNVIWESEPATNYALAGSEKPLSHVWPETAFGIYIVSYNVNFLGQDHLITHPVFLIPIWALVLVIVLLAVIIITIVHAHTKRKRQASFKKYV